MELHNWTDSSNVTNVTDLISVDRLEQIRSALDAYISPFLYIIGFPGNILSVIIWLQKRMRHSSGYYLAALALDDLVFLTLHLVIELHSTWGVPLIDYPVVCEAYPILFMASQHLSPFLVLAFTTERYISICHPFQREKFCTIKRAKIVIISMVVVMPCINAIHGYFWHITDGGLCEPRDEVVEGKSKSLYIVYSTTVDMFVFLVVPVTVLVLNLMVIREMRRLSKVEQVHLRNSPQRTGSTTVMLLAVSFYQIITTLPISIAYALYFEYDCQVTECESEEKIHRGKVYNLILTIIKEYGITHYVFNIFIYISTGKMFRQELKKLILLPIIKLMPNFTRDYASLRTNSRSSENTRAWMSMNGNNDTERTTDETLL